jgi:chaperonin GroEL (HSP60 family)
VGVLLRCRFRLVLAIWLRNTNVLISCPSEQVNKVNYLVGFAVEVIPKTLATKCGVDVVRMVTDLRSKHAQKGNYFYGIDGNKKKICDMRDSNVWEPAVVKNQVL